MNRLSFFLGEFSSQSAKQIFFFELAPSGQISGVLVEFCVRWSN